LGHNKIQRKVSGHDPTESGLTHGVILTPLTGVLAAIATSLTRSTRGEGEAVNPGSEPNSERKIPGKEAAEVSIEALDKRQALLRNCRTPTDSSPRNLHQMSMTLLVGPHDGWTIIIYACGSRWWGSPVKPVHISILTCFADSPGRQRWFPTHGFSEIWTFLHETYSTAVWSAVRSVVHLRWDAFSASSCVGAQLPSHFRKARLQLHRRLAHG